MNFLTGLIELLAIVLAGYIVWYLAYVRRDSLLAALVVIWRKKYLWLVGFFSAGLVGKLLSGVVDGVLSGAGLSNNDLTTSLFTGNINSIDQLRRFFIALRDVIHRGLADHFIERLRQIFVHSFGSMSGFLIVTILIFAVLIFLTVLSQGVLAKIAGAIAIKKNSGFVDGVAAATKKFRALFTLNVMATLLVFVVWFVFAGIPAIIFFLTGQNFWASVMQWTWYIIVIPLGLIASFMLKFALNAVVLYGQDVPSAVRQSWTLFKHNIIASIELAVILVALNLVFSLVVTSIYFFLVPTYTSLASLGWFFVVFGIVMGILSAYTYAAWTHFYLKIREGKAESRFGVMTSRVVNLALQKKS